MNIKDRGSKRGEYLIFYKRKTAENQRFSNLFVEPQDPVNQ